MSSQESFDELEPKIAGLVEDAIREVKMEFLRRLQDTRSVLDELLGQAAESLDEGAAAQEITESDVAEPVELPLPATDSLPKLHTAVARLDRCKTQNEILSSFVESCGILASRSALFLTREEGLQGWSSLGFAGGDEAFEALVLDYDEGSPWGRLAKGRGVIELDAAECTELCGRIDGSTPRSGVLIPIVLRDHLAAALYADQLEGDEEIGLSSLQLLAYVAAQALETLPLRERASTATLRLATEAPSGEPVLALWQFTAPPAEMAIAEEIEEVEEPAIEEEAEDLYAVEPVEELPDEDQVTTEAVDLEEVEEATVEVVDLEEVEEEPVEIVDFEQVEEPAEEEVDLEEAEAEAAEGIEFKEVEEEVVEAVEFEEAEDAVAEAVEFEETEESAEEVVELEETEVFEKPYEYEEVAEEAEVAAEADLQPVEATGFEVEPAAEDDWAEPEPVAEIEEPAEDEVVAVAEEAPVLETVAEEVEATPHEPEIEPAHAVMEGAQIQPPEDAQGPGWAFTTNRFSADGGGEAVHEEARRLARLLVTEIKLYNEEQVEAGRRNRNIYEVLREDIDRSRQIYEERVDDAVRSDADYFHDELVRILAAGESDILGL